jgi:hypothetical protein
MQSASLVDALLFMHANCKTLIGGVITVMLNCLHGLRALCSKHSGSNSSQRGIASEAPTLLQEAKASGLPYHGCPACPTEASVGGAAAEILGDPVGLVPARHGPSSGQIMVALVLPLAGCQMASSCTPA